jgi:hypothetical protein
VEENTFCNNCTAYCSKESCKDLITGGFSQDNIGNIGEKCIFFKTATTLNDNASGNDGNSCNGNPSFTINGVYRSKCKSGNSNDIYCENNSSSCTSSLNNILTSTSIPGSAAGKIDGGYYLYIQNGLNWGKINVDAATPVCSAPVGSSSSTGDGCAYKSIWCDYQTLVSSPTTTGKQCFFVSDVIKIQINNGKVNGIPLKENNNGNFACGQWGKDVCENLLPQKEDGGYYIYTGEWASDAEFSDPAGSPTCGAPVSSSSSAPSSSSSSSVPCSNCETCCSTITCGANLVTTGLNTIINSSSGEKCIFFKTAKTLIDNASGDDGNSCNGNPSFTVNGVFRSHCERPGQSGYDIYCEDNSSACTSSLNSNVGKVDDGYYLYIPPGGLYWGKINVDPINPVSSSSGSGIILDDSYKGPLTGNVTFTCATQKSLKCYAYPTVTTDFKINCDGKDETVWFWATETNPSHIKSCGSDGNGGSLNCTIPSERTIYCKGAN